MEISRRKKFEGKLVGFARESYKKSQFVILSYSAFIATCIVVFLLESVDPSLYALLDQSRTNYWGPVTSIFVHTSISHLDGNMWVLGWESVILVLLLSLNTYEKNKTVQLLFFLAPFASAVISNVLFFFREPSSTSAGASGFVYGVIGLLIVASLFGISSTVRVVGLRTYFRTLKYQFNLYINLLLVASFLAVIAVAPGTFIGVEPGVNFFVHGISLILGMFLPMIYFYRSTALSSRISFRTHQTKLML
jgi:membrane associated rhomboid family serine protease